MNDQALADLLRRVVREELDRALARPPRRPLLPADRAAAVALLPVVFGVLGDRAWTLQEVVAAALHPDCGALTDALSPHLEGGLRRLGKTFARLAERDIGGYTLHRLGGSSVGMVWQITETPETPRAGFAPVRAAA